MNKNKTLNKIFLILVSSQTILMGILFIVQILRIYYGNNKEYTSEICGRYLLQILPVILIWIVLIVVSYIYHKKSNSKNANISKMTEMAKLELYEYMCPEYSNNELEEIYKLLGKEKTKRKIAWYINLVVLILCSAMGLMYLFNPNHFESSGDLTKQAIQMTIHLLPWVIISFISSIIYMYYIEKCAIKSIEYIKVIIQLDGKKVNSVVKENKKNLKLLFLRCAIIVISLGLIIHGIINGGASDVLQKAINICTECIGLG